MKSSDVLKNLEPCPDCTVPMNVIINDITKKDDTCMRFGIECRECGDKWTEEICDE